MKTQLCTSAGGNPTMFVWDCPRAKQKVSSIRYLKIAEQVGFVTEDDTTARLTMMGGELCINGTIALASLTSSDKQLYASGIGNCVPFTKSDICTSIQVTLPFTRINNIILFDNIGYEITNSIIPQSKSQLARRAEQFALPAFGQICVQDDQIFPHVYVQQTNSLVAETACGSGSIAFCILSGISKVKQPTRQYISVKNFGENLFRISAQVKTIYKSQ